MAKFAVICASNMNRSMEAHNVLRRNKFDVCSFGTGSAVRLPGPTIDKQNIYPFGTPYEKIYEELKAIDSQMYTQNGLLHMLERNIKVKEAPQKFQEHGDLFDVIITCEERCFDAVCEELLSRGGKRAKMTHVINVEIKDNHEDAALGGRTILQIAKLIENSMDLEADIEDILEQVQTRDDHLILYSSMFC